MALVDDYMAVVSDGVVHIDLADQTLNHRLRNIEERRQTLDPLVQQLAPVNQNQSVAAARRDQAERSARKADLRADVDLTGLHHMDARGQCPLDRWRWSAAGRRRQPGLLVVIVERNADAEEPPGLHRRFRERLGVRPIHHAKRR
jgi:hypothetical protein